MPLLARLFVKTALVYLALALGVGIGLAGGRVVALPGWVGALGPAWVHLLAVGWLTQLIFGVAYWFFPRVSKAEPYGHSGVAWAAFALLNSGLALRVLAEPAVALGAGAAWRWALVASAALQALGVLAFVAYLWPRVRTK